MPGHIYGLAHAGEIRYVGRTKRSLKSRLNRHLREAREATPGKRRVFDWMRSVGFDIEILSLEADPIDLDEAERAWISTLRRYGCRLTNATDGGTGVIIRGRNPWNKGKKATAEARSRMSAAARSRDEQAIEKNKQALASGRARITAESRRRSGEKLRQMWSEMSPVEKAKALETTRLHAPESREKASASLRGRKVAA